MFELHSAPAHFAPSCAVFDCDGVLLDSETLWGEIQAEMFKRYRVDLTPELEASLVGISAGDLADRLSALTPLASEFDGSPEAFRDSVYATITTTEFEASPQSTAPSKPSNCFQQKSPWRWRPIPATSY